MHHHFLSDGALFDHAAVGGQIAFEYGNAAGCGIGVIDGADQFGIAVNDAGEVFSDGFAGAGRQRGVEQIGLGQLGHDGVYAAGPVEIFHESVTGGRQVTQVRSPGADLVGHIEGQCNAAFVGNGGQMEHGVGGAAQSHVDGFGVVESGLGHNIPGTDVLFHQFHDLHAGVFGQTQAGGVDGGNGAVAPQGHADGFGQAVHGVSGIHA